MWQGKFYKLHGCGNDFIIIDNRDEKIAINQLKNLAIKLARRSFSVGADGVIFLQNDNEYSYRWEFFNSDGSRAKMCINGARCTAFIAHKLQIANHKHIFRAGENIIKAFVDLKNNNVKVILENIIMAQLDILPNKFFYQDKPLILYFILSGAPHVVIFFNDIKNIFIEKIARDIQIDKYFPDSVNVNFAQVIDKNNLLLRTFERGLNKETYACGSGAIAATMLAHQLNLTEQNVTIKTSGGENLQVVAQDANSAYLTGKVEFVYTGQLCLNF